MLCYLCVSVQSNTTFNRDLVKAGTGRRFLGGLLDDTSYCYTLEVSFYSYLTAGTTSPVPYTEDGCILSVLLQLIIELYNVCVCVYIDMFNSMCYLKFNSNF